MALFLLSRFDEKVCWRWHREKQHGRNSYQHKRILLFQLLRTVVLWFCFRVCLFFFNIGWLSESFKEQKGRFGCREQVDWQSKMEDTLFIFPYTPTLAQSVLPIVPISLGPGTSHAVREAQYWHHATLPCQHNPALQFPSLFHAGQTLSAVIDRVRTREFRLTSFSLDLD